MVAINTKPRLVRGFVFLGPKESNKVVKAHLFDQKTENKVF